MYVYITIRNSKVLNFCGIFFNVNGGDGKLGMQ